MELSCIDKHTISKSHLLSSPNFDFDYFFDF